MLGPIESDARRFSLTPADTPGLGYPVDRYINSGDAQPDTPRALGYTHRDFVSYQTGFFLVQELPKQFSFQTGYIMSLGRHMLERTAANPLIPGTTRRINPSFGLIDIKWSGGIANFHWRPTAI